MPFRQFLLDMSFGFGVGDFIVVCTLAFKLGERCKASTIEFKDVSQEVTALLIVLRAIEKFWHLQDLPPVDRYELSTLSDGCKECLTNLEGYLDKYQSLGSKWKSAIDRMRWTFKNITPLPNRLLSNAVLLSAFNATLTQRILQDTSLKNAANSEQRRIVAEAQVLEKLNAIYQELQDGRRIVSCFTHVTVDDLNRNDQNAWHEVTKDLEDAGAHTHSITSSHMLIKDWIENVTGDPEGQDSHSESGSLSDDDHGISDSPVELHSLSGKAPKVNTDALEDKKRIRSLQHDIAKLMLKCQGFDGIVRMSSRSRAEDILQILQQPNPASALALMIKLYDDVDTENNPGNRELVDLPAKYMFHELDSLNAGYLVRTEVEKLCFEATQSADVGLSEEQLSDLVIDCDTPQDGKIESREFDRLCWNLLERAQLWKQIQFRKTVKFAKTFGVKRANSHRKWLVDEKPNQIALPHNWEVQESPAGTPRFVQVESGFLTL